ncbi:CATRA conflict system CASPASE/TPR repeat-associated protein [Actinoplanes sp. HUAS TT8]|uniref:CATRA conflict system CASPASE/TPR repeat-associated protein n=1 Tax=Actinoplanes sp. HUAS TT8 TaxID=3447453 RepID=UPI003F52374C
MQTSRLVEHELVAHLFAPADGPHAATARRQLEQVWRQCRTQLAMSEPVHGVADTDLPDIWPGVGDYTVVAAQQDLGFDRQAIVRRDHDVINLSMVFAAPIGAERVLRIGSAAPQQWSELYEWWRRLVVGGTTAMLGSAVVFQAKAPTDDVDPEALAADVRDDLAADPADAPDWWSRGHRTPEGFALWEASPPGDGPARRIVVLAGPGQDSELSNLTWSDGSTDMPPLARYLMHAAKLRYQSRVRGDGSLLRTLHEEVRSRLDRPDVEASELGADQRRLAGTVAHLRTLQHTAEIAEHNMRAAYPPLLTTDADVSDALRIRIPDDLAYLQILVDEVQAVRRVLDETPQRSAPLPSVLSAPEPAPEPEPAQDSLDLRMCFAVDIVGYSTREDPEQQDAQSRLAELLDRTLDRLNLTLAGVDRQTTGDGMNIVLPAGVSLHESLPVLLHTVRRELATGNRRFRDRLRLRLSAGVGMIGDGAIGFRGSLIVEVSRLLNSPTLKTAAVENPEADLVALISDTLHDFVIKPGLTRDDLPAGSLQQRQVRIKEYDKPAWLWVPPAS